MHGAALHGIASFTVVDALQETRMVVTVAQCHRAVQAQQ